MNTSPAPISVETLSALREAAITDNSTTVVRSSTLLALLHQLAERDAEVERLTRDRDVSEALYREAERAMDEANRMWREAFIGVVQAALIHAGMEIEQANISANEKADHISAYLAANGGDRA